VSVLNLASRPFRNERVPRLLFGLGCLALVAVTVKHGLIIRDLLPARTSKVDQELAALEKELPQLRELAASEQTAKPPAAIVAEWRLLKALIDKRTFSWTRLFASLEQVASAGVRIVSIQPQPAKGELWVNLTARADSTASGLRFLGRLQSRPEFADVYPTTVDKLSSQESGQDYGYRILYRPQLAAPEAEEKAAAQAGQEGEADAAGEAAGEADPGAEEAPR